jgi:hypothetical protein
MILQSLVNEILFGQWYARRQNRVQAPPVTTLRAEISDFTYQTLADLGGTFLQQELDARLDAE